MAKAVGPGRPATTSCSLPGHSAFPKPNSWSLDLDSTSYTFSGRPCAQQVSYNTSPHTEEGTKPRTNLL